MNTARCQMCESFRVLVVVAPGGRGLCLTCGWRWWEPKEQGTTAERRLGAAGVGSARVPMSPPSISVRRTLDRAVPPLPVSPASLRPLNPSHPSVIGTP